MDYHKFVIVLNQKVKFINYYTKVKVKEDELRTLFGLIL